MFLVINIKSRIISKLFYIGWFPPAPPPKNRKYSLFGHFCHERAGIFTISSRFFPFLNYTHKKNCIWSILSIILFRRATKFSQNPWSLIWLYHLPIRKASATGNYIFNQNSPSTRIFQQFRRGCYLGKGLRIDLMEFFYQNRRVGRW